MWRRGQKRNNATCLALALFSRDWQFLLLYNLHRIIARGYEALFSSHWSPGLCGLSHSPIVPPGLSALKWDHPVGQPPPCPESSPPQLPVSAPPTSFNECFLFTPLLLDFPVWFYVSSGWVFLFVFKLVGSFFCCVKRQSISTYASILAGIPLSSFLPWFTHLFNKCLMNSYCVPMLM